MFVDCIGKVIIEDELWKENDYCSLPFRAKCLDLYKDMDVIISTPEYLEVKDFLGYTLKNVWFIIDQMEYHYVEVYMDDKLLAQDIICDY